MRPSLFVVLASDKSGTSFWATKDSLAEAEAYARKCANLNPHKRWEGIEYRPHEPIPAIGYRDTDPCMPAIRLDDERPFESLHGAIAGALLGVDRG